MIRDVDRSEVIGPRVNDRSIGEENISSKIVRQMTGIGMV